MLSLPYRASASKPIPPRKCPLSGSPLIRVVKLARFRGGRQQSARNSIDWGGENRQLREILSKAAAWFVRETTRSHGKVPVRERSPGGLSDCQHVSASGCLPLSLFSPCWCCLMSG